MWKQGCHLSLKKSFQTEQWIVQAALRLNNHTSKNTIQTISIILVQILTKQRENKVAISR